MSARSRSWEELRREARKLESELDVRVAQYAKMCTSSGGLGEQAGGVGSGNGGEKVGATGHTKQAAAEIETLLEKLSDVNAAMGSAATGGADSRAHTLARHRDILTDFSQEFRRLSAASAHLQSRVALFGASTSGSSAAGGVSQEEGDHVALNIGGSSSNYSLLRERSTIYGAQERMDEVIGSAQATMGSIVQQRGLFTDIHGKINTIGAKFPVLNNIMGSIRRKKSKDTIILATVVCGCTLFLLIYWFSK